MENVTSIVRAATNEDVEQISHVLARAFRNDPLYLWMFPEERSWARNSQRVFALAVRQELPRGTVLTTEDRRGAAIWRGPSLGPLSFWLRMAVRTIPLLGRRTPLIFRGFKQRIALHPQEPHCQVWLRSPRPCGAVRPCGRLQLHEERHSHAAGDKQAE